VATTTITNNVRRDWLNGDVDFAADTINMALYNASGHGAATGAYTATAEVVGTGYTAKGVTMSGVTIGEDAGNSVAWVDWTVDPSWAASTITSTDCMIFHDSVTVPTADVASYIGDFSGSKSSSSGLFQVVLPAAAFNTAIIRIA
jgi:hypothetical protein